MQREKLTYSGKLLEADFFPVFSSGRKMPSRKPKEKVSTEAQAKYNRMQAIKKAVRIINENFDERDFLCHPTYKAENAPLTEEKARADITNYFRKVKYHREKRLKNTKKELREVEKELKLNPNSKALPKAKAKLKKQIKELERPFKYCYWIEKVTYKSGNRKGQDNFHFHFFMTGGLADKELEKMWDKGKVNFDNYQPEVFGPEAAAKYMSKNPEGKKTFSYSRNCEQPRVRKKDRICSPGGEEKMAKQRIDDAKYWENRYPGYKFLKCYSRYNEYNGHWYISAVMYKTNSAPPEWREQEWITEV